MRRAESYLKLTGVTSKFKFFFLSSLNASNLANEKKEQQKAKNEKTKEELIAILRFSLSRQHFKMADDNGQLRYVFKMLDDEGDIEFVSLPDRQMPLTMLSIFQVTGKYDIRI